MQIYLFVVVCAANLIFRAGNLCSASERYLSASSSSDGVLSAWDKPWKSSENYVWIITAPPGERVLLNIDRLHIFYSFYGASHLIVRDGQDTFGQLLLIKRERNFTSSLPPVYSNGRYMYVEFSKSWATFSGILATFRALSSSSDCPKVLKGNYTGVIYSPGFPFKYPDNKICSWIIGKSYSTYLLLSFTVFDLGSGCSDKVVVRNGRNSWDSKLGEYCSENSQAPFVVAPSGAFARVEFTSYWSGSDKGFLMFYRFLDSPYMPSPTPSWWATTPYPWYTGGWWTTAQRWTTRPNWEQGTAAPQLDSTRHTLAIVLPIVIGVVLLVLIILIFIYKWPQRATNRAPVVTAPPPSEIPLQVWPQQVPVPSTTFPAQQRVLFVPISTVGTLPGTSTVGVVPTAPLTSSYTPES